LWLPRRSLAPLFPSTTLFRSLVIGGIIAAVVVVGLYFFIASRRAAHAQAASRLTQVRAIALSGNVQLSIRELENFLTEFGGTPSDRKSTRLNSSHVKISYAVF